MYEHLRKYILPQLIPSKTKVMVAVSGGPDSMALSHILWRYVQEESGKEISLVLTHVHHGVRKESDDEAVLVQEMADQWKLPCLIHRFDSKQYAKESGKSFQEAAREWRYARWKADMEEYKCSLLATAHHLGDQAETILYRLLRGSGTAGLAGMYPTKDSIIRPLLTFSKASVLDYCTREAIPYALDHSNEEPIYVRNRIRLELLPELERSYNSRIQEILGRTGELLRWDEEYLTTQVEAAWLRYHREDLKGTTCLTLDVFKEPAAILSRLLRKAAMQVNQEPRGIGFSYISKIMSSQARLGWMQDLPGLKVEITNEGLIFSPPQPNKVRLNRGVDKADAPPGLDIETPLFMQKWTEIPELDIAIGFLGEEDLTSLKTEEGLEYQMAVFSRDLLTSVAESLVCRYRREGDKIWIRGVGHKPLKKVFQEAKIGEKERSKIPLVALGNEVLWIPGVRQSGLYHFGYNGEKIYCILVPRRGVSNLNSL
ncbi:tRNA lysidine(34) synthetase TilS [Desulfosporosinus hippei]|uniref:tRNA(Ile)-lysidine synthase n=1 Tax=Desulfosporosinus hippei DSM 8344 TaxID=1121419 RepID=A0A1G7WUX7_9FIRM|nr:tRNA lysidine(34) synthetase TilS [Desulfosporosinus hippei]SDG75743.1 tRNA(Ile)-lysidine synthase [Desulfosporosinus hippei DSM 8344]